VQARNAETRALQEERARDERTADEHDPARHPRRAAAGAEAGVAGEERTDRPATWILTATLT
jgi:hypothetical protein